MGFGQLNFWYKWFEEYPTFRQKIENVVGKKFMHPDWAENSSWKPKWRKYSISSLTAIQVAEILRFVSLPDGLFDDNKNLENLYKQLVRLNENNFRYQERRVFIHELFFAKIFPLEGGSFGPLKVTNESMAKMYWMSGRTRRTSGLEGIIDVNIINPEYTYTPNVSADSSEERKAELKEISFRNELVKNVLRFMEVPEFNDDRLLSELQIPYLLEKEEKWTTTIMETKYRVFQAIFDVYQAKRSLDDGYLNQLGKLSEAYVLGENGKVKKIYQTILPEKARLFDDDHLYANAGLDSLQLPDEWFSPDFQGENQEEKMDVYLKQLRKFLIDCGVANGPKFYFKERRHSSGYDFRQLEEPLYRSWVKKINNDYTGGNAIAIKSVTLDTATMQLINKEKVTTEITKGLYNEWANKFSRSLDKLESLYYRFDPPPGYIQTLYKRFENRKPIIPDTHWAGLNRKQVPLLTIDGRLTNSEKAFKVRNAKGLDKALLFFDLVLENDGSGYHPFYLSSLEIKPLQSEEINRKWKEVDKDSYNELIKAMYELCNLDYDLSGLSIYDKGSASFRSIRNFKLGKPVSPSTPYIEEQYGHYGKLLGGKLGLLVDSEVTPLLNILDDFFLSSQTEEWAQTNFTRLFQQWSNLRVDDRGKLIHHITELKSTNKVDNEILVIFNDKDLYQKFHQTYRFVIHLTCEPMDIIQLKQAAKELGFVSLDDIGTISAAEPSPLEASEAEILVQMFEGYIELEAEEMARLFAVLGKIGGKSDFYQSILRANELTKMVYGIPIPVTFPYYDSAENHYFVSKADSLYEIAARLLSTFGFTTYRSGYRDFKEIYEKLVRVKTVTSPNRVEKAKNVEYPTTFTDVPVEYEMSEVSHNNQAPVEDTRMTSSFKMHTQVQETSAVDKNHGVHKLDTDAKPYVQKHETDTLQEVQKQETVSKLGAAKLEPAPMSVVQKVVSDSKPGAQREATAPKSGSPIQEKGSKPVAAKQVAFTESKTEDKKGPVAPKQPFTLDEVLKQISENMVQDSISQDSGISEDWKIAIDPEEGKQIRSAIGENLKTALQEGPVMKDVKQRNKKEKIKIIDKTAQDPKEFLHHEYNGRCQVCATRLQLANGKSYFEVFRIREGKDGAWWNNRPFNILSLCPNCHALAKHGGALDFSAILQEAELVSQQLTFTQEVEAYHGDYYVVDIVHNGQYKQLVISNMHLDYFSALLEHALENELIVH